MLACLALHVAIGASKRTYFFVIRILITRKITYFCVGVLRPVHVEQLTNGTSVILPVHWRDAIVDGRYALKVRET